MWFIPAIECCCARIAEGRATGSAKTAIAMETVVRRKAITI
jgi:hypothetical protein